MKLRFLILNIAVLAAVISGCSKLSLSEEGPVSGGSDEAVLATKAVNTAEDAVKGSLLVYLDEKSADALESGNAYALDSAIMALGVTSYERVFPVVKRTEERARQYNLHRWYILNFPDTTDLGRMALSAAGIGEIRNIQYNTRMRKASDGISYQYVPKARLSAVDASAAWNDPMLGDQWHYSNTGDTEVAPTAVEGADINVVDAWKLTSGDPSIIVAVVDEGVQYDHPDLAANMWTNPNPSAEYGGKDIHGWNFVNNKDITWTTDGNVGHGTHVAGTVAAVNNNGVGVAGVAGGSGNGDGVRIMSCQIFDGFDGGDAAVVAEAAKYAADNGASILQCSFGYTSGAIRYDNMYSNYARVELQALQYFMDASGAPDVMDGNLIIFAAGNDGGSLSAYPGAYKDFISVTSFSSDFLPTYYTNYGPGSNIAAPGGEYYTGGKTDGEESCVLSTMPTTRLPIYNDYGQVSGYTATNYGYMQGTSMACPHMSGVAALALSYAKKLGKHYTNEEMKALLLTAVDDIDSRLSGSKQTLVGYGIGSMSLSKFKRKMGTGTTDAWKVMMQIEGTPYIIAKAGVEQKFDLDDYFGSGAKNLTYQGVEISIEDKNAIGLQADPKVSYGRLTIYPTKTGNVKLTVKAIAGGSSLGGGNNIGGMEISKEISIMVRDSASENGGWL